MEEYSVSEKDRRAVRALFKVTDEEVKLKVKSLKEWTERNPHLPLESKDVKFLNIMLLRGKFRVDVAKKNIENYFEYICRYPEIFMGLGKMKPTEEIGVAVVSPRPSSSWERIGILKIFPKKLSHQEFDVNRCILNGMSAAMIMFVNDYTASVRLLLDFEGLTINHFLQLNINDLLKLLNIHQKVLKMRISGIEFFNAPHLVSTLLKLGKLVLKPKLFSRISVHDDLSSLHKQIKKENLPSDYGGELPSIEELIERWDKIYEIQRPFFNRIHRLVKESSKKRDILGVQGSFKSLALD